MFQRRLEQELPTRLVGLTEIEIREIMRTTVDDICTSFEKNLKAWLQEPPSTT